MEEVVDIEEFNASVSDMASEPSCYYTGFNGPIDRGFCLTAQSTNSSDPLTLSHACKRHDWMKWETAIQEELKSLEDFNTFEVVDPPLGKKPVGFKYVFKTKFHPNGQIDKY